MGYSGSAAIVGLHELPPTRRPSGPPAFPLQQLARLAAAVLADAGVPAGAVDGVITAGIAESRYFVPSTVCEYLGIASNVGELVDIGGANAVGMVWRAAAMIELGLCRAVLCLAPGSHDLPVAPHVRRLPGSPFGASSELYGSPQAEFDIPYGNLGQNGPYAQLAQRYGAQYGYDPAALAKIAVDQRTNACAAPDAVFYGRPITVDDVLASPMVAAPLHLLEIVMPCHGGAAILVTDAELARRARHRPVWIKGFGERVDHKTPTYAADLLDAPVRHAAERAFTMAGLDRGDVDIVSVYDCYTITVLLTLEAAGFCAPGTGMTFVREHDLTYRGDFPVNTWGGQLSFGQAGVAGGMHHVCDASRQLRGQAGDAQVRDCHRAFVSGNGGILGEQNALVLVGD